MAARTATKHPAVIAERKRCAGIEGTLSKALRADGLRRSRSIGATETNLQQALTATAINLGRIPPMPASGTGSATGATRPV